MNSFNWWDEIPCLILLFCCIVCCKHPSTQAISWPTRADADLDTLAKLQSNQQPRLLKLPKGWTDLALADSTLVLDIRYATNNNFVSKAMYDCGRCLLRSEAAEKILILQRELALMGLGLKLFDCYRPQSVQQLLWDQFPDARYVTPPNKGSMHNRGVAVDLTLIELVSGKELDMGTNYDFFGAEAYHTYMHHNASILHNRDLLRSKMKSIGFNHIRTEWWHYSYANSSFEISDYKWDCPEM